MASTASAGIKRKRVLALDDAAHAVMSADGTAVDSLTLSARNSLSRPAACGGVPGELDVAQLDPAAPASPALLAALKARILEDAAPRPAKRARKSTAKAAVDAGDDDDGDAYEPAADGAAASASAGPAKAAAPAASAAKSKAEEKKHKLMLKKIFDQLKKACKADGVKFQGSPKTLKVDEVVDADDFAAIFRPGAVGTLVQPTPTNKPKSTVTIIDYASKADLQALFGDELKGLKGNRWTVGGGPSFAKSLKLGPCDVEIQSATLNYTRNGMKCTLKFEVAEVGGDYYPMQGPSMRMSFGGGRSGLGGLLW